MSETIDSVLKMGTRSFCRNFLSAIKADNSSTPYISGIGSQDCSYSKTQVLDQNINTNDATGRLLFNMLGAIAQFETEIRAERQMDGINKAKERGVAFGRKRKMTTQQIKELRERRKSGVLIKTLMANYNLSKASVYRYLDADDD